MDDIVDGLIVVAFQGAGGCQEYGIGSDEAYSVLDVANMFGGTIRMTPEKRGNRMSAVVMNERLKSLGWSPKRNLPDYIKSTT